ncbi:hypothetical protein D4764_0192030 [Takifugu flavidus]|uniref:Ig-like domain-containing protein n=1 Tax=Takifugu flavidus TaxID=433684 RepID=A0A5C6MGE8_9TELE|nr:hypothetical protein D4764_0192030 [Takifugu flavidus]
MAWRNVQGNNRIEAETVSTATSRDVQLRETERQGLCHSSTQAQPVTPLGTCKTPSVQEGTLGSPCAANPVDRTRALLKCHVTSTDKSVRSVSLTEDGATKANWITVTGPLPSGDGSVILILTAEVPLIHTNIYGCVVQTEDRTITVMWDLRVFANPVDRTRALLKCHVTSTDKSVRSVSLTEDGAPKANWITVTGPLPSGDGSVILILTAEVPLIHTNIYGCVVQTEDRTITVMWDGNTLDGRHILYIQMTFWRIIGIIFTVCCLISIMTLWCPAGGVKTLNVQGRQANNATLGQHSTKHHN